MMPLQMDRMGEGKWYKACAESISNTVVLLDTEDRSHSFPALVAVLESAGLLVRCWVEHAFALQQCHDMRRRHHRTLRHSLSDCHTLLGQVDYQQ